MTNRKLYQIGERNLIKHFLSKRYGDNKNFGDDCTTLNMPNNDVQKVLLTTDPCPKPMAWILGYDDYYYLGWLLATINLSDLASMGAKPLGFLSSIIVPNDIYINDFERLFDGIDDCLGLFNITNSGGNIKESSEIQCSGVAIGTQHMNVLNRFGAENGYNIVVFGELGNFWAGVIASMKKIKSSNLNYLLANVLKPVPKINTGLLLSEINDKIICIDNSDGLYPSLLQLAETNNLKIELDFDNVNFELEVLEIANRVGIDPIRLVLGWGDWQLICGMSDKCISKLDSRFGKYHLIGKFSSGNPSVNIKLNNNYGQLMNLDSERFSKSSWFTDGIENYVNKLMNDPIIT